MSVHVDRSTHAHEGWGAKLVLGFEAGAQRTALRRCEHKGPLRVQRPFYPEEDGTCHVYLLHPPGGIVGGDTLDIQVEAGPKAAVLLTTPGATKVYRSGELSSHISHEIHAGAGARVEWLPQETIAFSGAKVCTNTIARLAEGSSFVGWEILCLGRPAAKESFSTGFVTQRFEVWRGDRPLYCERLSLQSGADIMRSPWGLAGRHVLGTLVIAGERAHVLAPIRDAVGESYLGADMFGGTQMEGVTVFRFLGGSTREAHRVLRAAWRVARRAFGGDDQLMPRIWNT